MKNIFLTLWFLFLSICLMEAQEDKLYKGAELYTKGDGDFLYGKIEVRLKAAIGSGIISSFYGFADSAKDGSEIWEEVDLEIFGKNDATTFQSNIVTDTPGAPNVEEVFDTGFSLGDLFHTYCIEWRPESVIWRVDNVKVREIIGDKALELTDPLSLHINIWSSNSVNWVGPFNTDNLPEHMFVNWVKFYAWEGSDFAKEPTWKDDFDILDSARWEMANWTFDVSNVDFDKSNVTVEDGFLVLSLTDAKNTGFSGTPPSDAEIDLDLIVDAGDTVAIATTPVVPPAPPVVEKLPPTPDIELEEKSVAIPETPEVTAVAPKVAPKSKTTPEPAPKVTATVPKVAPKPTPKPKTTPKPAPKISAGKVVKTPKGSGNTTSSKVYTNDAQSLLMFKKLVNAKTLYIHNAAGAVVKKIKNYSSGQSVDISFLSPGSYYIVVDKKSKYKFKIN